ncbi:MAG TPA: HD domain-containing protein [Candidatus Peribacterales bacterium]|nr:HD domain-containing protein [Candidatus Peribacterales bacterium]
MIAKRAARNDQTLPQKAATYARTHLSLLRRRTGENYASHGREVAEVLRECLNDASLLAVAHLHDLPVHPDGWELLEQSPLTTEERELVERMHALRRLNIDAKTQDLDTALEAFVEDERLLPLRMAHRVNDVRNLARFPKELQQRIAHETLHMYTAIAGRLGMHAWRYDMEDACFAVLQPKLTRELRRRFEEAKVLDNACLTQTIAFLQKAFHKEGVSCSLNQRVKGIYSTFRKMALKRRKFEDLTDRLAIRIVVPDVTACYQALGVVHGAMHPMPGKLKDYIGAPKENGYRSIHTVVFPLPGVTEQPIEIQIRTEEMHKICEYGASAHGDYKAAKYALRHGNSRVNLFRNLQSLRAEVRSPKQFSAALRKYFSEDHLAIFDHENNLHHLRKPAEVLDFICHAFPRRFQLLQNVKVNGRKVGLDTSLRDGDIIEPVFGRKPLAKKEWLMLCRHSSTKKLLRSFLTANLHS